jgi:hypothetical protein
MSKRHDDALVIQMGACNPSGIARALVEACDEARGEHVEQVAMDPAVRLIVHQLAHLCHLHEVDDLDIYQRLDIECRERSEIDGGAFTTNGASPFGPNGRRQSVTT